MNLEQKLKHYRISRSEYDLICEQLGRPPEGIEFALYSALWSEHCSYKSSRFHLKKFFGKNERVVTESGENAGVIDLGEGERIAFKMESHNHPSFIEPYEGAATGVGGILRDIFTMGARPIALANYLCFGEMEAPRMRSLVDGVVRGIGGYGNCVGVATITGQTEFHKSYNDNILVNALAVGLLEPGQDIVTSVAKGPGNLVVYVGAKTGRDGIHGASMASEAFDEDSDSKKPTIQKGDPFYEKLLIESCMEVIHSGLVDSIQDMGAAGLTSSSFEMAAKGNVGLEIHLDKVPLRDESLSPEDILLSESQERMLLICKPENLEAIQKVFSKWGLDAVNIGTVIKDREVRLHWRAEQICAIDPHKLTESAPEYQRPFTKWQYPNRKEKWSEQSLSADELQDGLKTQLQSVWGCERDWIFDQYDQRVGAKTVRDCSHSVGVQRLPSGRGLGLVLGCRPYVMRMDAHIGGMDSVAYPAIELAAKGFLPLAVTDCLNYGSPENNEIMSEFVSSLEGMNSVCKGLNTPVISGNVSFYNETLGRNITSTPSTGLTGLRDNIENIPEDVFTKAGSEIFLLSLKALESNGLAAEITDSEIGFTGELTVPMVTEFTHLVRQLSLSTAVLSTSVVGKFGLPYRLAKMCTPKLAAQVSEPPRMNFREKFYEVIFTVDAPLVSQFKSLFASLNKNEKTELQPIGTVVESSHMVYGKAKINPTAIGGKLGL